MSTTPAATVMAPPVYTGTGTVDTAGIWKAGVIEVPVYLNSTSNSSIIPASLWFCVTSNSKVQVQSTSALSEFAGIMDPNDSVSKPGPTPLVQAGAGIACGVMSGVTWVGIFLVVSDKVVLAGMVAAPVWRTTVYLTLPVSFTSSKPLPSAAAEVQTTMPC